MGLEEPIVFRDIVGQAIKMRLMNYAFSKYTNVNPETINNSIDRLSNVVEITREAILEALKGETELLIFKQTFDEPVPTLFISGVMHAIDVVDGKHSVSDL